MRSGHHKVEYRAMPSHNRFGMFSAIFHHERCYTQDELQFRERVLAIRANTGIDADLLQSSDSWFHADSTLALTNVNEGSWLYSAEFQPKQSISEENFHIGLIDAVRLRWSGLSVLTRTIGNYLLIRNSQLATEHLNQPINYVFLDLVRMLQRLATADHAEYVAEQLRLIQQYVRAVEIHVSYSEGSDRLFMADCRHSLEQIVDTEVMQQIHSRQFKQHFQEIKKQLNRIGEMRHTLLHYAFADKEVNPHPFWETFSNPSLVDGPGKDFPVLAAKSCARSAGQLVTRQEESPQLASLELDEAALNQCQGLSFIDLLDSETKIAYGQSVSDLQEILRFQQLLDQLVRLFDQAGEVFTLVTVREQMTDLLQTIDHFIQRSQQAINLVQEANTRAYHQIMQDKQDLGWWDKWVGNKENMIKNFITNQDNLARFSVFPNDFVVANHALEEQTRHIIQQLQHHSSQETQVHLIDTTRRQIDELMLSMQSLVGRQRALQGLASASLQAEKPVLRIKESGYSARLGFWSTASSPEPMASNYAAIAAAESDSCPASCPEQSFAAPPTFDINGLLLLAAVFTIPLAVYVLKCLYDRATKGQEALINNDIYGFMTARTLAEDRLALVIHKSGDQPFFLDDYKDTLEDLKAKADKGHYDAAAMQNLADDLAVCLADIETNAPQCLSL